jgi:hypothetical protein
MSDTRVLFAARTVAIGSPAGVLTVQEGDPWAADDPLVKAHPDLFVEECSRPKRTVRPVVEQATAAPGQLRTTRR